MLSAEPPEANGSPGRAWTLPDVVWAPLAVAGLIAAVGGIALLAGQPWLFPSLGPSAYLLSATPDQPASQSRNIVVGHFVGFIAGSLAVWVLGAGSAPSVLADKVLAPVRVEAAALAGGLTMAVLSAVRATHPPAAATTLLVALGGFQPRWGDAARVAAGVLILATLGQGVRHVRTTLIRKPGS